MNARALDAKSPLNTNTPLSPDAPLNANTARALEAKSTLNANAPLDANTQLNANALTLCTEHLKELPELLLEIKMRKPWWNLGDDNGHPWTPVMGNCSPTRQKTKAEETEPFGVVDLVKMNKN
ncbi:hypothetical protein K435DRAFT_878863 [Dendrothele bispora CBS 962.96]|uniref:Uncharacterized protein n=1 Tax=Dendrothele bispora (strain CBS 962.96) TaxID=1314807 RepID=A0A4S8KMA0_DENBC|nr:hypothetical protein K435DRAFT_878863 [Dendrothele bispora CBS 962.96]